ncbi:unnamed protein product [Caenorhabditis angaria]|uniref:NR LBD domain-containing protein n=1 Tax=Caenorhabditis angaria TaxID=860376 RepID=A0A9P1IWB9_9PELO|nr:unnamed protein product [Caenorhabditis angaria]
MVDILVRLLADFKKCKAVGMRENYVNPTIEKHLKRFSKFYKQLEKRKFEEWPNREEQISDHFMLSSTIKKYSIIILENLEFAFPEIKKISDVQLKIIRNNFLPSFMIAEVAYQSEIPTQWMLPNGTYVDTENVGSFYNNPRAAELYRPYWDIGIKNCMIPIIEANLDRFEFQFLAALIFWDSKLPKLTTEIENLCEKNRQEVMEELSKYLKCLHQDESPVRVAKIVMLLKGIGVAVESFNDSLIMTQLHSFEEYHRTLYELNGLKL